MLKKKKMERGSELSKMQHGEDRNLLGVGWSVGGWVSEGHRVQLSTSIDA